MEKWILGCVVFGIFNQIEELEVEQVLLIQEMLRRGVGICDRFGVLTNGFLISPKDFIV